MTIADMGGRPPRERFVDAAPYDPADDAVMDGARPELDAPAWRLAMRRFRRHRLAVISLYFLAILYLMVPFMGFFAPYAQDEFNRLYINGAPQSFGFFDGGEWIGPHTYELTETRNVETFRYEYTENTEKPLSVGFFCEGATEYNILFGLFTSTTRLFCPPEGGSLHLLGTNEGGYDVFSRVLYGAQVSLTIGLVGITISFLIGITLGGLAGYFGGMIDAIVMRLIEIMRSLPDLPLFIALAAAIPADWSALAVFFMLTVILGLLDWPGVGRAVRSKFLAIREEDFVGAAELMGASSGRIVRRHLLPNFSSHLIASAALSIPAMILAETALSFLGLGIQPPYVSWGSMLNDVINLSAVAAFPWLMAPFVPVVFVVLAFNFLGDGLRDALDPYSDR